MIWTLLVVSGDFHLAAAAPPDLPCSREATEPSIGAVQAATLQLADLDPSRTRAWIRRIRAAAFFPRLKVQAGRGGIGIQILDALYPSTAGWRIEVDASWSLDELIFRHEEIQAVQSGLRINREREHLITLVTGYYFERQRLLAKPAAGLRQDGSATDETERALRIAELTALLNGLTGGIYDRVSQSKTSMVKPDCTITK